MVLATLAPTGNFTSNSVELFMEAHLLGCLLDVTDRMDEFVDLVRTIGQDRINVTVDYGQDGTPNP
jgi:hypothetical protein